ncbi:MAG TPA: hypothetical protein VNE63_22205 [Candidatus Acidoferrales bacterium]|nr:hypothetical protein [Candidatus Acidoferrales bacterium]
MDVMTEYATYRVLIQQRDGAWEKLATAERVNASLEATIRDLLEKLAAATKKLEIAAIALMSIKMNAMGSPVGSYAGDKLHEMGDVKP